MKRPLSIAVALAFLFLLLQFFRPSIPSKPATAEIHAPDNLRQILRKSCYSCHSDERRLSWFDEVVPVYWLVRKDILKAREHLNFSTIGNEPDAIQKAKLYEAVNMIQHGVMPPKRFLTLHREAGVTPKELVMLKDYLSPWSKLPGPAEMKEQVLNVTGLPLDSVRPALNGMPLDPSLKTWKLLSYTDRGDNYTFRMILGNEIAVRAVAEGRIQPWPDGAKLAKIAWNQVSMSDGTVHAGDFWQVELMVKDSRKYASTEGWGWGRWRGLQLKPYGKDASFARECTGCHLAVKDADYVFTLPMTATTLRDSELVNNSAISLPSSLPFQPLSWTPITMFADPAKRTFSVLYGNDSAVHHGPETVGAVIALVTWAQHEDPNWFGARIPGTPVQVEFVIEGKIYQQFVGLTWEKVNIEDKSVDERKAFLLSLKPMSLPW